MNPEPKKYKPFGWRFWLLLIGSLIFIYIFIFPSPLGDRSRAHRTEAISNLHQIGLALHEFQKQHGAFPNNHTAELLTVKHPSEFNLSGTSSNALFRQLFATEIVDNEAMFYAKFPGISRPDGDTSSGHLLEKGEVAFAYIAGLSTEDNPSLPIAFGPIVPGTNRFDPKPFNGRGILLRIDNSVSTITINKNGEARIGGGESLLDPNNKLWNGKAPDIRYPE